MTFLLGLKHCIDVLEKIIMHISSDKELRSLLSGFSAGKRGLGGGMTVRKQSGIKKGGVYFKGVYRDKFGKQKECHLGTYGKGVGELTLKQARDKWEEMKKWASSNQKAPADFISNQKQEALSQKTFQEAVDAFLSIKSEKVKPTTIREYKLKLSNQIIPLIGRNTPLEELEWINGGRRLVMDAVTEISKGGKNDLANRCQHLMKQVFNFSISRGWMSDGRNPADKMKGDESPDASINHHPSIDWKDVPLLMKEVNLNRSNSHIQSVMATKLLLLTFLRTGALTRLEWSWFDTDFPDTITIPGSTSGLKRKRGKNDHIPHHVPITPEMRKIFEYLLDLNGNTKYVFQPMRDSRFPHLDPSAINNYFRNLGYKDKLRAHGWRRTALTAGIDVLKTDRDVIRRQMGHLPEGKVNQAYDGSIRLDERRDFLHQWSGLLVDVGLKV